MVGKRSLSKQTTPRRHRPDQEDKISIPRRRPRPLGPPRPFHDSPSERSPSSRVARANRRRDELTQSLLHGIDADALERYRLSEGQLRKLSDKRLREFYTCQNARLDDWREVDAVVVALADHVLESMDPDPDGDGDQERCGALQRVRGNLAELLPDEERERRARAARKAAWAINFNVVANVILLAGKAVAAVTTGSLSLVASLVDSALDLLCTLIVWSTNRLVLWRLGALRRRFPVGRRRLEPVGILVFSIVMIISFLQILRESVSRLIPPHSEAEPLGLLATATMVATIVIKGAIGIACRPVRAPKVQALVQDCKTDVVFNSLSLLFPLVGYRAGIWWLDPLGAGLLSIYIVYDWGRTSFDNVVRLSGEAADDDTLRKLTYLAWRFSPVVDGFKSIIAYHAGDGVWAEFDVLLGEDTPLGRSHDIAETLQYCAEALPYVDRAFVTTDYAAVGPTGHALDTERNH